MAEQIANAAIETVTRTGAEMHHKYKEASLGGLTVSVVAC